MQNLIQYSTVIIARILFFGFVCVFILQSARGQVIQFKDVTKSAGLYDPLLGIMGHGAAFGDYDNDGLIDLYVGGFADRPADAYEPAKGPIPNNA